MSQYQGVMTEEEQDELQSLILSVPDCPGAEAFVMGDAFEVHPRTRHGEDFPDAVRLWLADHGFRRAVDTQRGPFYYRSLPTLRLSEAADRLGITPDTLRQQIHNGALRGTKQGRDWIVTEHEVERYRRERRDRSTPMNRAR